MLTWWTKAKHLRLEYAGDDAHDLASALYSSQSGLYAKVVPQVLTTRADAGRNGVISMLEMTRHIAEQVPQLTAGAQTPGIDMRFESNVFVAGL